MASYVEFRDVSAVLAAANGLTDAAANLKAALAPRIPSLKAGEGSAIASRDSYGGPFWTNTYAAPGGPDGKARNESIYANAEAVQKVAAEIGPNVTLAATQLVWQDALAAQAMSQGNA